MAESTSSNVAVSGADVPANTSTGEVASGTSDRAGGQKLSQEEKVNPPKSARSLGPLADMINAERRNK